MLILAFVGAAGAFLLLDLIWLGFIADEFYRSQMGELIAPSFNILAAITFYVIFLVGVTAYAVRPALHQNSLSGALGGAIARGAAFGFFCYATYDLTNLAVMQNYPALLAIVDIAWGTFLTAAAAGAGALIGRLGR